MASKHARRMGIAVLLAAVLSTSACIPLGTSTPQEPTPEPVESEVQDPIDSVDEPGDEVQEETPVDAPPPLPPAVWQPSTPKSVSAPASPPAAAPPSAPVLTLRADTGSSAVDGVTNNPTIDVAGLDPSGSWERWDGTAWAPGVGTSFNLGEGTFAIGDVGARQTVGGVTSATSVLARAVTVDLTPPAPAVFTLEHDTGNAGDWTSADGTVAISVADPEPWQLRTHATDPWGAPAASVLLPIGTTAGLSVRQADVAGNERITDAPPITIVTSLAGNDPVLTPTLLTTLLQRNTGFTVSGVVPSDIGDVLLDNLSSVAANGISGTLNVTNTGIAGVNLVQLDDALSGHLRVDVVTSGPTTVDLSGWTRASEVRGGPWGNTLIGGSGDDLLVGGNGDDTLVGGEGDDELYGSNGINRLRGGPGEDLYSLGGTSNAVIITVADAVGQPIDRVIGFISGLDHFELEHPDLTPGSLDPAELYIDPGMMFTGMPVGNESFVLSGWNGTTFDSNRRLWACYETGAACTALANLGTVSFVVASDILVI